MIRLHSSVAACVAMTIGSVHGAPIPKDTAKPFYPTTKGSKWVYQYILDGSPAKVLSEVEETLTSTEIREGDLALDIESAGSTDSKLLVSKKSLSSLESWKVPCDKPFTLLQFPLKD